MSIPNWRDVFTVAGLVVGVIGLLAAYIQWRLAKIESRPEYRLAIFKIIGPFEPKWSPFKASNDPNLAILYKGRTISSASRAYVALWNSGRKTLDGDASLTEEPLRIVFPKDCVVLGQPNILAQTRPSIHFSATNNSSQENVVDLAFAFLDHRDGALVEVLYGGGPGRGVKVEGGFKSSQAIRDGGTLQLRTTRGRYEFIENALGTAVGVGTAVSVIVIFAILVSLVANVIYLRNPLPGFFRGLLIEGAILGAACVVGLLRAGIASLDLGRVAPRRARLPRRLGVIPSPITNWADVRRALRDRIRGDDS
jgi:hypothetical protein